MRNYYKQDNGFVETGQWKHGLWMNVVNPDDDDRHFLTEKLNVPEMFLEYLGDPEELPRVEREGVWTMTIVLVPIECSPDEGMPFRTAPFGIISKDGRMLLTVSYYKNAIVRSFVARTMKKGLNITKSADLTLQILYETALWYLHYLKTLTNDVVGAEKDLKKSIRNDDLIWLMHLQKSLVFFNTAIKGNVMLLERVKKIFESEIDEELLEDVDIELRQADSTVCIYSDILENTLDAYASIISNNVNGVMKRMTGLSIILMVPTLIASLYGMNVDILIGGYRYAFWFIIIISMVLTACVSLVQENQMGIKKRSFAGTLGINKTCKTENRPSISRCLLSASCLVKIDLCACKTIVDCAVGLGGFFDETVHVNKNLN